MNKRPMWWCEADVFNEGRCDRQCADCADDEAWDEVPSDEPSLTDIKVPAK